MSKSSWDSDGNRRVTSDSGRKSWQYKNNKLTEIAHHHKNGTTSAYEPRWNLIQGTYEGPKKR